MRGDNKLIKSDHKIKSPAASPNKPFFLFDRKTGAILDANDAACSLYGYKKDEILKLKAADISAEPDKVNNILETYDNLIPVSYHRKKDGSVFIVEITANQPELDGSGVLSATIRDITEVKKTGLKLQKSEKKYRDLFEEMIDGFALHEIICNKQGHAIDYITLEVNKSYELCLDTPRETVIGRKASEFLPVQELRHWLEIFAPVALTGKSRFYEVYSPSNQKYFEGLAYCPKKYKFAVHFRDITERKKSEEELAKANDRLALAQKSAGSGLWDWDIVTGKLNCSAEFYALFGLDSEKDNACFDTWRRALHPEDILLAEEKINESIKDRIPLFNEYRIVKPSGEIRWINAYGNTIHDENGRAVRMSGICIDITERKNTEDALYESMKRHNTILQTAMSGFWLADMQGHLLEVNDSYCRMSGYSTQEILAMSIPDLEAVETGNDTSAHIQKVIIQGDDHFESRHRRKDGSIYDVEISVQYQNVEGGRLVVFLQDITERKKAERELKNMQLLLSASIESPKDMIILAIDMDYNYLFFNNVHKNVMEFAYGKKVKIGMNILDCITSEVDIINAKTNYSRALKGDSHSTIQEYGDKKRSFYETFYNPIINEKNEIIGATAFARDITQRKRAEEEITYLSFHDQLTGLYNRRFFVEEIMRMDTERQLPLSFIMGDLNGLKIINDVFGHTEGDKLLLQASEILRKVCRSDDIPARWGGDEFVILLSRTSLADSEEVVKRIKKECKMTNTQKIPISLSLGSATKEKAGQDIQSVIVDAESNMYKNKLAQKESLASSIVFALGRTLYEKSNETKEHTDRIRKLALQLGKSINLPSSLLDELSLLASLHDIGKVAIPEKILLKRGKLTEKEWAVIKRHPEIGFNIAQSSLQIAHIAKPILACHENYDGSGYPLGLKGDAIPVISRIILIVDAYDVMISGRLYKDKMTREDAIAELGRCAGSQFDPVLVEKFIEIVSGF